MGGAPQGGAPQGGAGACADVKGYSELATAFSKCTGCHSTELTTAVERMAAPLGFDYDTYEAAIMHLPETRNEIDGGDHPSAPDPQLTPQELADLLAWIDCGGPE